jgi:O-antigen ligase
MMTLGLAYWILMLVWLVFGTALHFGLIAGGLVAVIGSPILIFVLLLLLGWQVFGPPMHR